ncbi:LIC_13387 family protein [Flavitalea flava]
MTNENPENSSSMISKNKSGISLSGFFISPVALIRISSILFVGLTIGHLWGYPWTSHTPRELQLVGSMKSVDFLFFGERSSYWNLYFGWGLWIAVLMITVAIILWLLSDLAPLAPRRVGTITVVISATCLIGAYFSFRYFYTPPLIMECVMFITLLIATVQLLKKA